MLGSMPCRKSQIGAEFHFLLIVKTTDAFSNHVMMHDSFSIVVAIIAILILNLPMYVYGYPKLSVVASRCLISSDHVLLTEIWKLFLHLVYTELNYPASCVNKPNYELLASQLQSGSGLRFITLH